MPERDDSISPSLVLQAYSQGLFPMAPSRDSPVQWCTADPRTVLPLHSARFSRSLLQRVKRGDYQITFNQAFVRVISACALPRPNEPETWINEAIIETYTQLHKMGYSHSVEAWAPADSALIRNREDARFEAGNLNEQGRCLVGGLYGVAIGGAFFGESMFSVAVDASKVCLHHLVQRMKHLGAELLDVQFSNPHLTPFGVIDIPTDAYQQQLTDAIGKKVDWSAPHPARTPC